MFNLFLCIYHKLRVLFISSAFIFGVNLCANESFIVNSTFVLKFTVGVVPTEMVSILVQGTSGTLIYIFD